MEKVTYPKCKIQFNHVLITLDTIGSNSKIIVEGQNKNRLLKTIQTAMAVGENAANIKIGDKVMLDTDRLNAAQESGKKVFIRHIGYDKSNGEILTDDNSKEVKEENIAYLGLITDREILMVI